MYDIIEQSGIENKNVLILTCEEDMVNDSKDVRLNQKVIVGFDAEEESETNKESQSFLQDVPFNLTNKVKDLLNNPHVFKEHVVDECKFSLWQRILTLLIKVLFVFIIHGNHTIDGR